MRDRDGRDTAAPLSRADQFRVLRALVRAEWAAGIFGLRLFIGCVAIATFMMGTVWMLGDGLSTMLSRGGTTFLGGDVSVTTTNVPLPADLADRLSALGAMSEVAELRSSAQAGGERVAVELKGVDGAYPLYGGVTLGSGRDFRTVLNRTGNVETEGRPAAIVEPTFLARTGAGIGDVLRLGGQDFVIADTLSQEPDRLSVGRFMVGPRIIVRLDALRAAGLIQRGSIVEFRYRLRDRADAPDDLVDAVRDLRPEAGWELETPADAGDRVLRTVDRTTTFLGMVGITALAIGIAGAWAAAKAWVRRRIRTIALYRLSGATPGMVLALHAVIVVFASFLGLAVGLGASAAVALPLLDVITTRLHVPLATGNVVEQMATVALILVAGLAGTGLLAMSSAAEVSPGAAMRSGEAPPSANPLHAAAGAGLVLFALGAAALSLPIPVLAGLMTLGLAAAIGVLALAAAGLAKCVSRRRPRGFLGTVIRQSLENAGHTATRTIAIGVGIIGITAIVAAQNSLQQALTQELPERVPDLVLIDVQPDQVAALRDRVEGDPGLEGLQADPFMRMTLTQVNGVPVEDALVREDKSWVIEGDRSFSWAAEPTGAALLAGDWWDVDYDGQPLVSPEEDLMEAFDLTVGDRLTYSVLGRTFTSEVVNIRKEYHRTFRPEYLLLASPQPFRDAPHTWIMSLQGKTDAALDGLIRDVSAAHGNVTAIDIRPLVAQVRGVIDGATLASFLMAGLLVVAGAMSLAALVAADVDARRQEALVFSVVGASRREIALVRLAEAAAVGAIAAALGGLAGMVGGYFVVTEALRVDWAPSAFVFVLPVVLGVASSVVAGAVGGLGAVPGGRGQLVRHLAA
ncbi:FtsX-like permease family protein [Hwanghaeella grinnelliae]|uniref:FtsX-like permease family protein n=1 Tax=Hwanghaeella grinnelliae TaxID=2500179 RepID=A0A437QN74_9PROT|nr:FtsX-like permease family protein [Hwanghaeella grinnelliae]RVU35986.1 FtsX-like permease family protein [Hwanghaeella grinnelliae]